MTPALIDLETVLITSMFWLTIPAARPYFVLFAHLIPSSIVLWKQIYREMFSVLWNVIKNEKRKWGSFRLLYLNFIKDITGPKISSLYIFISSCNQQK